MDDDATAAVAVAFRREHTLCVTYGSTHRPAPSLLLGPHVLQHQQHLKHAASRVNRQDDVAALAKHLVGHSSGRCVEVWKRVWRGSR